MGYGDVSASNKYEYAWSLVCMIVGVVFYSGIAGTVVELISCFNGSMKVFNDRRSKLEAFCDDHAIPAQLKMKLENHLEFEISQMKTSQYKVEHLLSGLAVPLKIETMVHLHRDLISSMSIFLDGKTDAFAARCVSSMRPQIAYPQDIIVQRGAKATEMFLVKSGVSWVIDNDTQLKWLKFG